MSLTGFYSTEFRTENCRRLLPTQFASLMQWNLTVLSRWHAWCELVSLDQIKLSANILNMFSFQIFLTITALLTFQEVLRTAHSIHTTNTMWQDSLVISHCQWQCELGIKEIDLWTIGMVLTLCDAILTVTDNTLSWLSMKTCLSVYIDDGAKQAPCPTLSVHMQHAQDL